MASTPNKDTTDSGQTPETAPKKRKPISAPRPDEMSPEVLDFITAIDDYKRKNERPFPSWTEILEVIKGLGYEKSNVS
ncbi:MAG: hypothetical protein ACI835_000372 [Planctomycetota bacterium]|jgi:hypothetical protein